MRLLPIISFTVFAVCFEVFGCTNASDSGNDDEVSSMQPSLPEKQNSSTNFLLLVTDSKISKLQCSTKNSNILKYEIEDHIVTSEDYKYVTDFTSNCVDSNIYILKHNAFFRWSQVLEVIHYNKNNKFEKTKIVNDMFQTARSIASDYVTGKIYWIDRDFSGDWAIKVTHKSFKKSEYIIHPSSEIHMEKLQVYPKHSKIFFSSYDTLWYTSNSPNSTANLLLKLNFENIIDFTIDYLTDKLCWIDYNEQEYHIKCVVIDTLDHQFNTTDILTIAKISKPTNSLVAFNNTFYWTAKENNMPKLYFKNGNETIKKADLSKGSLLSFIPSVCPFLVAEKNGLQNNEESEEDDDTINSSTEGDLPKQNQNQQPALSYQQNNSTKVLLLVTDSKIFTSQYSAKNGYFTNKYQIEDNSTLPKSYKNMEDFTSTCLDNNIYILKSNNMITMKSHKEKTLEVIRYNSKNDKFERINQVKNMFDNATSITSDYMTGKIYWNEYNEYDYEFAIKVTDESFKEPEYIIYPTSQFSIGQLRVYQDNNILFFVSGGSSLWYTFNSTNSTANEILPSDGNRIVDITIDHITDKLCWVKSLYQYSFYNLNCASIMTFGGPLYLRNIVTIEKMEKYIGSLVAFDNTFYWTTHENHMIKLYFKNGNEPAVVEKADIPKEYGSLSIVPSSCYPKELIEPIVSEKAVDTKTFSVGWWPINPPWPIII